MTFNYTDIEKDLEYFFTTRTISTGTKRNYVFSLKSYCNFIGKRLPELIQEAEEEQLPYIDERNRIITPNVEFSMLKTYLNEYQEERINQGLTISTVEKELSQIRAVYRASANNIRLPKRKKLKQLPKNRNGLTQDKISKAIHMSNYKYRALISFIASTGIRIGDAVNFTIQDWLDSIEMKELDKAIYNDDDIIGFWEFYPKKTKRNNLLCQTFNSPESNNYIREYLKYRVMKNNELNVDDPIFPFPAEHKAGVANWYFKNKSLQLYELECSDIDKMYNKGEISSDEAVKLKNDISKFRSHALRSYFITVCGTYLHNLKIGARFAGHTMPEATDDHYIKFRREDLEPSYLKILKYLTFEEDVIVREITSKDFDEIADLKQALKDKNSEFDKIIENQKRINDKFNDLDLI